MNTKATVNLDSVNSFIEEQLKADEEKEAARIKFIADNRELVIANIQKQVKFFSLNASDIGITFDGTKDEVIANIKSLIQQYNIKPGQLRTSTAGKPGRKPKPAPAAGDSAPKKRGPKPGTKRKTTGAKRGPKPKTAVVAETPAPAAKPVAKKTAAKKPAVKKVAAKKPAAKKPAAKKPVAKKAAPASTTE